MAQTGDDAPATKADVEKYLQAIDYRSMIDKMMDAMSKPMHQMVHDEYVKDKNKVPADFEARTNEKIDQMMKDMPWDEMIQAMVPSYQKHFTRSNLDHLVAFYSSPTGQKLMREMPAIMTEAMQLMMPIMHKHMEAVNQSVQQEMAEMGKEGQSKPSQNPAPQN